MAYPTGTPVEEQVLDNVRDTLAAIASPSFYTTVATCKRQTGEDIVQFFLGHELPGILVSAPTNTSTDRTAGMLEHVMTTTVWLAVQDRETWATALSWFVQDVTVALLADNTRGGVAADTAITGHQYAEPSETGGHAVASVDIDIRYRHLYADPNTPI